LGMTAERHVGSLLGKRPPQVRVVESEGRLDLALLRPVDPLGRRNLPGFRRSGNFRWTLIFSLARERVASGKTLKPREQRSHRRSCKTHVGILSHLKFVDVAAKGRSEPRLRQYEPFRARCQLGRLSRPLDEIEQLLCGIIAK
jgi:hypothetical protein